MRYLTNFIVALTAGSAGAAVITPVSRESFVEATLHRQALVQPVPVVVTDGASDRSLNAWSARADVARAIAEQTSLILPEQVAVVLNVLALEPGTEFGISIARSEIHFRFRLDEPTTLRLEGFAYRDDEAYPFFGAYNDAVVRLSSDVLIHEMDAPAYTSDEFNSVVSLPAGRYTISMIAWAEAYSYGYIPSSRAGLFATMTVVPEPGTTLLAFGAVVVLAGRRFNA
jgi:hypothetical protein